VRARIALPVCVLLAGCGSGHDAERPAPTPRAAPAPAPKPKAPLRRARCAADVSNCRTAEGRIVYIEAVDPDGDGDAHFVLASRDSVTAPGVTVIDVERTLRPHPLPGLGTQVSAAGPVYHGSYGQLQIQATELHVAGGARP
jgi:hypothetical protein